MSESRMYKNIYNSHTCTWIHIDNSGLFIF